MGRIYNIRVNHQTDGDGYETELVGTFVIDANQTHYAIKMPCDIEWSEVHWGWLQNDRPHWGL